MIKTEKSNLDNKVILDLILTSYKTIEYYYPYKVFGGGPQFEIVSLNDNSDLNQQPLRCFINLMIQLGASAAGAYHDNKSGVAVKVDGLDFPVYFYKFDGKYVITECIHPESEPIRVYWKLEY